MTQRTAAGRLGGRIFQHRRVLLNTTRIEVRKRFAGSLAGTVWLVLYPGLLFVGYAFVFVVVMRAGLPNLSPSEYLVFLFSGLVPFLGISEALSLATPSLRLNMHLVRNVLIPLELIPVRSVLVAVVGQIASTALVLALSGVAGRLGWSLVWLPVQLLAQLLFCCGLGLVLALGALVLPDAIQIVNLAMTVLLFVTPIGYRSQDAPFWAQVMVSLNPLRYFVEGYRNCVFADTGGGSASTMISLLLGLLVFTLGARFLERMRDALLSDE